MGSNLPSEYSTSSAININAAAKGDLRGPRGSPRRAASGAGNSLASAHVRPLVEAEER